MFSGKGDNWTTFVFQFERFARWYEWSEQKKAEKLVDCLSDKVLEYAVRLDLEGYVDLKKNLARRFERKDAPAVARRKLSYIRQDESEAPEEFSQRVYFLSWDTHPNAPQDTIDEISVEVFLRGCRDKRAAEAVLEKRSGTIHKACKALEYIKESIANHKAIFGTGSKPILTTSRVNFEDYDEEVGELRQVQKFPVKIFSSGTGAKSPPSATMVLRQTNTSPVPPNVAGDS
jgi:hypothetical protein